MIGLVVDGLMLVVVCYLLGFGCIFVSWVLVRLVYGWMFMVGCLFCSIVLWFGFWVGWVGFVWVCLFCVLVWRLMSLWVFLVIARCCLLVVFCGLGFWFMGWLFFEFWVCVLIVLF